MPSPLDALRSLWQALRRRLRRPSMGKAESPAAVALPDASGSTSQVESKDRWLASHFEHQGRRIDYRLFVPAGFSRPGPLVLMLHGCTQDPQDFATGTRMNEVAGAAGALVLYPTQNRRHNLSRCWNWFLAQHQRSDRGEAALLAALVDAVATQQGADPARIYAAGLSAGAAMAAVLGRTHGHRFAALGLHSGLPFGAASDLASATQAMKEGAAPPAPAEALPPTLVFHGDADRTVHPANAERMIEAAFGSVQAAAVALASAELLSSPGESAGGRPFERRLLRDPTGRVQVEAWTVHGGGHAWSGGAAAGSYTDPAGPDASRAMWRFFSEHAKH